MSPTSVRMGAKVGVPGAHGIVVRVGRWRCRSTKIGVGDVGLKPIIRKTSRKATGLGAAAARGVEFLRSRNDDAAGEPAASGQRDELLVYLTTRATVPR